MCSLHVSRLRDITHTRHLRPGAWAFLVLCTTILAFATLFVLPNLQDSDAYWPSKSWGKYACRTEYCEACRGDGAFLRSPANALSNMVFVEAAVILLVLAWEDHAVHRRRTPTDADAPTRNAILGPGGAAISALLALMLAYAGLGSFFFHAGMTTLGHKLDMSSVYALTWVPAVYIVGRHAHGARRKHPRAFCAVVAALQLAALVVPFFVRDWMAKHTKSSIVVPVFALVDYVLIPTNLVGKWTQVAVARASWFVFAAPSLAILLLSWAVRSDKDIAWLCSPWSAFQGHAAWHAGAAVAVFLMYLFLRGEHDEIPPPPVPLDGDNDDDDAGRAEETRSELQAALDGRDSNYFAAATTDGRAEERQPLAVV